MTRQFTMAPTVKKQRERSILDSVYAGFPIEEIVDNERPDFVLRLQYETTYFGVEITEFYHSEVSARLERIPGYTGVLLEGGEFKHKNDAANLTVDKVAIEKSDGASVAADLPAIMQRLPTLSECACGVAHLLARKATILDPSSSLTHVNLIVRDRTRLLYSVSPEDFFAAYFAHDLRSAVCVSPFREIFFATDLGGRCGVVPLRLLLTLSELFFFAPVLRSLQESQQLPRELDLICTFASYLSAIVQSPVYTRRDTTAFEVVHGDTALRVGQDGAVNVRMYADRPILPDSRPAHELDRAIRELLIMEMARFRSQNTFRTSLFLPITTSLLENE